MTTLEPYTSYVCPGGGGYGHSSHWTGAYLLPRPTDGQCICGETYVKEDDEVWTLSWEMLGPYSSYWAPVRRNGSRHSTHQQRDGLLALIEAGEPIRRVELWQRVS